MMVALAHNAMTTITCFREQLNAFVAICPHNISQLRELMALGFAASALVLACLTASSAVEICPSAHCAAPVNSFGTPTGMAYTMSASNVP